MRHREVLAKLIDCTFLSGGQRFVGVGLLEGGGWKDGIWWSEDKMHKMILVMTVFMV